MPDLWYSIPHICPQIQQKYILFFELGAKIRVFSALEIEKSGWMHYNRRNIPIYPKAAYLREESLWQTVRSSDNEIAAGKWDDKLRALYGDAAQEICRQRARYCAALEQFELYFGPGRQVQVYSAPGRAELGGNHTDHQHGYGLAAAVTLDLVAVAAHNTDGYVRVKSRGFNKLDVIDLTVEGPQEGESTHSASLIRGIAEGFRAAGKAVGGFDAYTASDVLRGSGLSSSAAFEMGMAAIWNGEYGCGLAPAELAKICQYAENTYFGKPSGLLDQLTSAVGGIIFADFADPQQPVLEKIHADGLLPPGMSLCVTDTRGSHSELTGEFAAIRQEMEQIASVPWAKRCWDR